MTELRFDGRVAIVTGAGRGLGKEYALLLAARGARLVVTSRAASVSGEGSDVSSAEMVAREIRDAGGEAVAVTSDVATPEGGESIVRTALDAYGRVDIVVNNAGVSLDDPFADMTLDTFQAMIDMHLKGAFHVIRPAWTTMREQGYGRVINTSSSAGVWGVALKAHYGAAKTGLLGLTRVLALEGAKYNIKVNVITPTGATRMLAQSLAKAQQEAEALEARQEEASAGSVSAAQLKGLGEMIMSRFDPALVAPVVAFLAHEDCPVSGEIYTIGGGQVSRVFIGMTKGYYNPMLSPEDVRDHFAEIRDETGYTVPAHSGDEMAMFLGASAAWSTP